MHPDSTELLLWTASLFLHLLLLVVLFVRRRAVDFPFFTTLIAANLVKSLTLYAVYHHGSKHSYLIVYTSLAVLDLLLQLCVTYELATHIFCPTGTWAPDVIKGFLILAVFSVVVAAALASMPTPPEKTLLKTVLDRLNLFSSALVSALFVGMIAFSVTARLPWKTHVARIAQGLGFYQLLGIVTEAGHNITGTLRTSALSHELSLLRITTYLLCVSYWIVMLWLNAPAPKELPEEMRRQLFTLQRMVEYDLRKLRTLKR